MTITYSKLMFKSEIRNENNVKLEYYGGLMFENYKGKVHTNYFEPTNKIELHWTAPFAKHNEVFIAKFDREENGVRIYNITDNFLN